MPAFIKHGCVKAGKKVSMSVSSTSGDPEEVDSNGDRSFSDSPADDDDSGITAESPSESENSKPTLLSAEKIWQFPVSSEYGICGSIDYCLQILPKRSLNARKFQTLILFLLHNF